MDTSTVCRGVLERARAKDNRFLGTNPQFPTVVESDVEVPSEVPAKNGFRTKDTDDSRILSTISKPGNFYPTEIGGSKDACFLIGERIPEIAVRRFAISHKIFGDTERPPAESWWVQKLSADLTAD